jgi:tetratricopeptide (TPR) repeat protein
MQEKPEEQYERGMEAFDKGDYENAERFFRDILSMNPNFADIQNKMGIIYNQTNRLELAARAFEKALKLNPGYTEASLNLAVTYSDLGKYDKAKEISERAASFTSTTSASQQSIDPFVKGKLADEHLRVGKLYYGMGLLDDAIEEYRKALRLSPKFPDIITQLGIALRDKGKYDEAIKEFNRAKEINPNYIPARLQLGISYYSRGFYGLAEEEWQGALKIDPNNTAVQTYLNFIKPKNP